jgi:hypothetical protein
LCFSESSLILKGKKSKTGYRKLVINNGWRMDRETMLDAVRNVEIKDGKI